MSPAATCEGAETISSMMGLRLRPLEETMPLVVATDLPLEVVPLPMGRLLLWGHVFLERLFEKGFGREEI